MMLRRFAPFVLSVLLIGEAFAHTLLKSSTPAANGGVDGALEEVVLEFNDPVRLTLVNLMDDDGARHALGAIPTATQARFVLELRDKLRAGAYVIEWRAVGADTHIVSGEIPFEVKAAAH